jgi:SsrA-binding protein
MSANLTNSKARFEYHILETEVAGIMLQGSELKSLREGKAGIGEAFIWIDEENLAVYIKNMYIKNEINNAYSHEELRERKLLMTKKQILKWVKESETKGMAIVPLRAFFDSRNKFKVEIALGKGKKLYDKREAIKKKDVERDVEKELKK